ncbi:MAG: cytosolic protein [Bacteroidia bacterium]|nr:cytosolic protein [Bacteroidota bacterium]MBP6511622.1 cytosolic protein [Bacteroidia bacterium]MBP7244354.1 cytosolic protein [Bacteroidia bacterium]
MQKLNLKNVTQYVEENIGQFHSARLEKVVNIELKKVLKSKNPYLFRAKNVTTANEIIEGILSAYISSSEETVFGNWLERLAIFINDSVYHGRKSGIEGIDLDFDKDNIRYIVSIKSGPNWGNDSQVKKLIDNFNSARKRLSTSGNKLELICVNGCCYGQSRERYIYKSKGNYYKFCGQKFWEFISGDEDLYTEIIKPLGHEAETKNNEFNEAYGRLVNKLTKEFLDNFCDNNGNINWDKLIVFNSSENKTIRRAGA